MEMLGIKDIPDGEDKIYELDSQFEDLTHKELLKMAVKHFED
jgi:hypothetical protein